MVLLEKREWVKIQQEGRAAANDHGIGWISPRPGGIDKAVSRLLKSQAGRADDTPGRLRGRDVNLRDPGPLDHELRRDARKQQRHIGPGRDQHRVVRLVDLNRDDDDSGAARAQEGCIRIGIPLRQHVFVTAEAHFPAVEVMRDIHFAHGSFSGRIGGFLHVAGGAEIPPAFDGQHQQRKSNEAQKQRPPDKRETVFVSWLERGISPTLTPERGLPAHRDRLRRQTREQTAQKTDVVRHDIGHANGEFTPHHATWRERGHLRIAR